MALTPEEAARLAAAVANWESVAEKTVFGSVQAHQNFLSILATGDTQQIQEALTANPPDLPQGAAASVAAICEHIEHQLGSAAFVKSTKCVVDGITYNQASKAMDTHWY